jgi:hypothetical protein
MTKKVEEFFYVDADGNKQDRDLHNPILRAVDYPIDDTIMGPIRERNRRKYLAEQKERHAKLKMQQRLAKARSQRDDRALLTPGFGDAVNRPECSGGSNTTSFGFVFRPAYARISKRARASAFRIAASPKLMTDLQRALVQRALLRRGPSRPSQVLPSRRRL